MDMLSRYLYAVYSNLPKASQRDDIVAEIAEALQAQIDERAAELGHPLSDDEEAAMIKAYGHPRLVAARYGTHQALIGPDLLPFYWPTLICVLSIIVGLDLFVATVAAIKTGDIHRFWAGAGFAWDALWIYTGVITAIFALLERVPGCRTSPFIAWITRWDPRRLPKSGSTGIPRNASFFEALGSAGMLVLLLDQGWARRLVLFMLYGPAAAALPNVIFTSAWLPLYGIAVAATAILALANLVTLIAPLWTRVRDIAHLVANAALASDARSPCMAARCILAEPRINQIAIAALVIGIVGFALRCRIQCSRASASQVCAGVRSSRVGKTDVIAAVGAGLTGAISIFLYLTISLPLFFHISPLALYALDTANFIGVQAALHAGFPGIVLGQAGHVVVSLIWGFVFVALARRLPELLDRPVLWGVVYGVAVMLVMHYVVVPARTRATHSLRGARIDQQPGRAYAVFRCAGRARRGAAYERSCPTLSLIRSSAATMFGSKCVPLSRLT